MTQNNNHRYFGLQTESELKLYLLHVIESGGSLEQTVNLSLIFGDLILEPWTYNVHFLLQNATYILPDTNVDEDLAHIINPFKESKYKEISKLTTMNPQDWSDVTRVQCLEVVSEMIALIKDEEDVTPQLSDIFEELFKKHGGKVEEEPRAKETKTLTSLFNAFREQHAPEIKELVDNAKHSAKDFVVYAKPVVEKVKEQAKPVVEKVKEKGQPKVESTKQEFKDITEFIKDLTDKGAEKLSESDDIATDFHEWYVDMKSKISDFVDSNVVAPEPEPKEEEKVEEKVELTPEQEAIQDAFSEIFKMFSTEPIVKEDLFDGHGVGSDGGDNVRENLEYVENQMKDMYGIGCACGETHDEESVPSITLEDFLDGVSKGLTPHEIVGLALSQEDDEDEDEDYLGFGGFGDDSFNFGGFETLGDYTPTRTEKVMETLTDGYYMAQDVLNTLSTKFLEKLDPETRIQNERFYLATYVSQLLAHDDIPEVFNVINEELSQNPQLFLPIALQKQLEDAIAQVLETEEHEIIVYDFGKFKNFLELSQNLANRLLSENPESDIVGVSPDRTKVIIIKKLG